MNSTRIRWALFAVAAVVGAVVVSAVLHTEPVDASSAAFTAPESHIVVAINERRVQAGLQPLQVDATLTASAVEWTSHMVAGSFLAHADPHDIQASAPGAPDPTAAPAPALSCANCDGGSTGDRRFHG